MLKEYMEQFYTTDLKYLLPLAGVIIGWLLTNLSGFFKGVTEKQKMLGKALTQLHFLYFEQSKLLAHFEFLKDRFGIGPDYEKMRLKAMERYVLNNDNLKVSLEIVKEVSAIYPLLAMDLKGLIENYAFSQKMKFSSTSSHKDLYLKLLSAFEVAFDIEHKVLRKIIFRLAFGHSTITWIRIRWKYSKIDKGFDESERPKFFGKIEEEVDKIYATSEERESEVNPHK
jgi:hypothetical protein